MTEVVDRDNPVDLSQLEQAIGTDIENLLHRSNGTELNEDQFLQQVAQVLQEKADRLRHRADLMRQRADEFEKMAANIEGPVFDVLADHIKATVAQMASVESVLAAHAHVEPQTVK